MDIVLLYVTREGVIYVACWQQSRILVWLNKGSSSSGCHLWVGERCGNVVSGGGLARLTDWMTAYSKRLTEWVSEWVSGWTRGWLLNILGDNNINSIVCHQFNEWGKDIVVGPKNGHQSEFACQVCFKNGIRAMHNNKKTVTNKSRHGI